MRPVARGVAVFVVLASLSVVEACGSDTTANDDSPGKMATSATNASTLASSRPIAIMDIDGVTCVISYPPFFKGQKRRGVSLP